MIWLRRAIGFKIKYKINTNKIINNYWLSDNFCDIILNMVKEIVGGTPTMAIYLLQTLFFAVVGVPHRRLLQNCQTT